MRNIYTLLGSLLLVNQLSAQTLIAGGAAGNGDFESGATGWTLVNGSQTNKWVIGPGATPGFGGNNAIYVSSSPAAPYAHRYDTTATSISYFYRDFAIPAGTTNAWLQFDYISGGERVPFGMYSYDYPDALKIYVRPTSVNLTAGQPVPGNYFTEAGFTGRTSWLHKFSYQVLDVSAYAGSTMRVIFQWQNDNLRGTQPPAALDNIELYTSCQGGTSLSLYNAGPNVASVGWNTIAGATGYQIRYRRHEEPETVATYANPVTINGGNAYSATLAGLQPNAEYIAEVRPTGLACTDYTRPLSFSTSALAANDSCNGAVEVAVTDTGSLNMSSFIGATPGTGLAGSCSYGEKADAWFRFTAGAQRQVIEAAGPYGSSFSGTFQVYRGGCGALQLVTANCPASDESIVNGSADSRRLLLTNLVPGETYQVRVLAGSAYSSNAFRLSVLNEPSGVPVCTEAVFPANGGTVLPGTQTLRWNADPNAYGYYYQVAPSNGWSSQGFTRDTFLLYNNVTVGANYSWYVKPVNRLDAGPASCTSRTFTAGVATAVSSVELDGAPVRFYPNPVADVLTVQVGGSRTRSLHLSLLDAQGRIVRTAVLKTGTNTIAVGSLPQGVYHAVVHGGRERRTVSLLKVR